MYLMGRGFEGGESQRRERSSGDGGGECWSGWLAAVRLLRDGRDRACVEELGVGEGAEGDVDAEELAQHLHRHARDVGESTGFRSVRLGGFIKGIATLFTPVMRPG